MVLMFLLSYLWAQRSAVISERFFTFSSQISKHGMEFYLDTIYWGNTLFMEIGIIMNHHFNVLSKGGKNGLSSFLLEVSHCEFPLPQDRPLSG